MWNIKQGGIFSLKPVALMARRDRMCTEGTQYGDGQDRDT
jgi:hypothetical protein